MAGLGVGDIRYQPSIRPLVVASYSRRLQGAGVRPDGLLSARRGRKQFGRVARLDELAVMRERGSCGYRSHTLHG